MTRGGRDEPISVLLVDDHAMVRAALRALLERHSDLEVRGEAADLASLPGALAAAGPDVLLLDVNLPDGSAVEAIPRLREQAPRIVVLTMERDLSLARRALELGALGFLYKDAAHLELIDAVRAAAAGRPHVPPALAAGIEKGLRAESVPLSRRETEVLRLMALGHTNREIAAQLSLSVRTVETHRAHIQQKLGLSGRPELTRYALDRHLLDS